MDAKNVCDVLSGDFIKDGLDVGLWIWDPLSADHSLEHLISVGLTLVIDNTWAIDQINALRKRNILPHFGLTRNGCHFATRLFHECIDHGRLADVRIANKAH